MSNFLDVIKEASKGRESKEYHYHQVRQERWAEMKSLAEECDRILDGRRRKRKRRVNG